MRHDLIHGVRLYFTQAWFSYRALYAWTTPMSYLANKFGFPFFTMLLFVFMGKFMGMLNPVYIVVGNILLIPSFNGINGISLMIGDEKRFGALSYLLGSPAPRGPLFLGRALFPVLDGLLTVLVALPLAMWLFNQSFSQVNLELLLFCVVLIALTTSGVGFFMGSISLITRDGWTITTTLSLGFYILVGVNFPVDLLPGFLRVIAYGLPMTRGIQAARMALAGSGWASVAPLITGEAVVGAVYLILGYALFLWIEKQSLASGNMDVV